MNIIGVRRSEGVDVAFGRAERGSIRMEYCSAYHYSEMAQERVGSSIIV